MSGIERLIVVVTVVGFVSFVLDAIVRPPVVYIAIAGAIWTIANLLATLTASRWRQRAQRQGRPS